MSFLPQGIFMSIPSLVCRWLRVLPSLYPLSNHLRTWLQLSLPSFFYILPINHSFPWLPTYLNYSRGLSIIFLSTMTFVVITEISRRIWEDWEALLQCLSQACQQTMLVHKHWQLGEKPTANTTVSSIFLKSIRKTHINVQFAASAFKLHFWRAGTFHKLPHTVHLS